MNFNEFRFIYQKDQIFISLYFCNRYRERCQSDVPGTLVEYHCGFRNEFSIFTTC